MQHDVHRTCYLPEPSTKSDTSNMTTVFKFSEALLEVSMASIFLM
jgi:hypothetical protein